MADNNDDYNRGGMLAFVFSMVFVFTFFLYLVVVHPGVDLGENVVDPNATPAEGEVQKFDMAGVAEPWVENADVATHGAGIYKANCAMCHGEKGMGDGAAGAALNPKPRNLVDGPWKLGGDSISLFKTLQNGIPGSSMAAYAHLKAHDRWALVQYIRSITKDKPADNEQAIKEFAASAK